MNDKFLDDIERIASVCDKGGMRGFLLTYLTDDAIEFLNKMLSTDFKKLKTTDWEEILEKAETNRNIRKMLTAVKTPKWVFIRLATKYDDFDEILSREDLTEDEMNAFLKFIGTKKVKEMLLNDPDAISQRVMSYLVELPDSELKKYDYLPLRVMVKNIAGFKHNENTYIEMYGDNEDALSEIINNKFITNETKLKAFDMGCNIEKVINPPKGEITAYLYNILAQTIFETDAKDNYLAVIQATDKLNQLIKDDKLSYSCQMDFLERYKANPYAANDIIIKSLARYSQADDILAKILEISYHNTEYDITHNRFAGYKPYEIIKNKTTMPRQKKMLFLEFYSHRPNASTLKNEHLKEAAEWNDKNLNKLLTLDIDEFNLRKADGKTGEYDIYFQFYKKLRTITPERAKLFALPLLLFDNECLPSHTYSEKQKDKMGEEFVSVNAINTYITNKYGPVCNITKHEYDIVNKVVNETINEIKNNKSMSTDEKENLINNFLSYQELLINDRWNKEEIRRKYPDFFCPIKHNAESKFDTFKLDIQNIAKMQDNEIKKFNKYISKINDVCVIKCLLKELTEGVVNSVNGPTSPFLFIAVSKCNSIFETINNRYYELENDKPKSKSLNGILRNNAEPEMDEK